jgi:hypothetical protein
MLTPVPKRNRRRLRILLIVVAIAVPATIAALPRIVEAPPVRRLVLALANRALAPTRVELATLRLSWTGPTRLTGLVLRDPRGKAVVRAPRATLDRSLWQLLVDRPRYGTLTLDGAAADIERRADGSIDLAEALDPILAPDPKHPSDPRTDFTLKVVWGTLRFRSPELAEPVTAGRMDLTLKAPAAPAKLSWSIALANPSAPGGEALEIGGHYDQRAPEGTSPELALILSGRRWPVAVARAGIAARGRFEGRLEFHQGAGNRTVAGDAYLLDLDAAGPALAGDRLRLDRIGGAWDLSEAVGAWTVRRLDLSSPIGALKAEGTLTATPGATTRIQGHLDLAALARQLPHALRLRDGLTLERGLAQVRADIRSEAQGQALDVEARISDLIARDAARAIALNDPATVSAQLTRKAGRIGVGRIAAKAAFLDVSGSGDLDRGVSVIGTLDLGRLQGQLRDLIDFGGLGLAGRALLSASYRRTGASYAGQLTTELHDLSLAGLSSAPLGRDLVKLDCTASGPASETGLPGGWATVRLGLKAADGAADLTASRHDATIALTAVASGPIRLAARDGLAEGRFAGSWTGQALQIDEIRVGLRPVAPGAQASSPQAVDAMQLRVGPRPVDPGAPAGSIALAARGRFDTATGDLVLGPLPGAGPEAFSLTAEGVHLSGLGRSGEPLQGDVGLGGDLARLDRALTAWTGRPEIGLAGNGSVRVTARKGHGGGLLLSGEIDARDLTLAAANGLVLEHGGVHLQADLGPVGEGRRLNVEARISELVAHRPGESRKVSLHDPATVTARLTRKGDVFAVDGVEVKTAFLDATGTGDLDQGVKLTGTLDLARLRSQLQDLVRLDGLDAAGGGRFAADYRRAGASYSGRFAAELRGLKLVGLTTAPLLRDALRLDAAVSGPAAASGVPTGWTSARLGLKSGDVAAGLTAKHRDAVIGLEATAAGSIPLARGDVRAETRLVGRWVAPALEFDSFRLGLRLADPRTGAESIALTARGRFDTAKGELALQPSGATEPGTIAPLPEGLRLSGLGGSGAALKIEGGVLGDLAALDRSLASWTGGQPTGIAGALTARVLAGREPNGPWTVGVLLDSRDLSRPAPDGGGRRGEGPVALGWRATYHPDTDRVDLAELALSSRYGTLKASGSLAETTGRLLADLNGNLEPDWTRVNALVAASVEPGARLQGKARPFHLKGPLRGGSSAEILRGLDAELGVDLSGAQAFGLRFGPTPIVARCAGGKVAIEPIETTLNGGRASLRPEVVLDDPRGTVLRLAPGSAITDAEIDDEVSKRVLAYVAPILHESTQVRGHLSAAFDRAEFPIDGGQARSAAAEGRIIFREVVFGPGPLAQQLLGLVGRGATPALRLDQTVKFSVANGRVSQSGLAIDLGPKVQIVLDGSVGFDGTLALRAGVPITASMLGNQALLGEAVDGTRVAVPIGGTLSRPGIDQRALQVALREAGRSMLRRGAEAGAEGLLQRLAPAEARGGATSPGGAPSRRPGGSSLPEEALRFLRP